MFLAGDGSGCYFYKATERAGLAAYHGQLFSWEGTAPRSMRGKFQEER